MVYMIENIIVTKLDQIEVDGGNVMHAMKSTDPGFINFGEAYFSKIGYNKIKAWKRHKKMTLNLVVPYGKIEFVFIENINSSCFFYMLTVTARSEATRIKGWNSPSRELILKCIE